MTNGVEYEPSFQGGAATVSVRVGDVKLKATCKDAGSQLTGLALGFEKPGFFIFSYDLPTKAAQFQFMSAANVFGKQAKLTYIHPQKANATIMEGTLLLDARNKITGKYSFLSGKSSLKYSYVHPSNLTFEPSYDFATESWNFSLSQKVRGDNNLRATYETSPKVLGLEWTRESKETGTFKVSATVYANESKPPKLFFENTWDLEF